MSSRPSEGRLGLSLGELAAALSATLIGDTDAVVSGVRHPREAAESDLTFVFHPRQAKDLARTRAGCLLTTIPHAAHHAHELPCAVIAAENPHLALARALELLYPRRRPATGVHPTAVVDPGAEVDATASVGALSVVGRARIGAGVEVAPLVYIDDDVEIGEDARVGPGCVLMNGVRLGRGVILQPGAVLGADGFGYAPDADRNVKVPQVGGVRIDDEVEVGANACVDRGAVSDTVVGRGTKLDNLVQVGHGVEIGENAVLIAQVGVGGDTRIGARALLAGQVGVVHNVVIGDDARVGAKGGVTRSIPARAAVSGVPAYPHRDWLKTSARLRDLDGLFRRLDSAERELAALREEVRELRAHRDMGESPESVSEET